MTTKRLSSEAQTLENHRVALENAGNQTQVALIMSEYGYDEAKINEGKSVLQSGKDAYDYNKTEHDETSEAYAFFKDKEQSLDTKYRSHRKKAKVVFRKDHLMLEKLALSGSIPTSYVKWLEVVSKFYTIVKVDETIQQKLARLKITPDEILSTFELIGELNHARALYLREKGESQDATAQKDKALAALDDWMSEFYAVAKIALEDHPQLLESLGKVVK